VKVDQERLRNDNRNKYAKPNETGHKGLDVLSPTTEKSLPASVSLKVVTIVCSLLLIPHPYSLGAAVIAFWLSNSE
jgi:hypothetical protein